ncbi:UvrD-helicase domain-containing protein [Schnuerera sp. xch1]|uniref:UvrD-helicase domain-containing protein n=1 Tax=Schnuerera sp. xch1 TaxID=2874283 RepID=UPI001CC1AE68|nr:UvrD-helicase domain-containing protein [Schnuerera sp. xch1]MBZ2174495.1 UvrD-helicase domain-containing protein [Schnuerera sp. xch1]
MGNTREQDLAIKTIDRNLAVNAGAGTGKTKVLTERYIYILQNGNLEKNKEVESIVAITFTKKATQEMKKRIREEIKKRFQLDKKWRRFYRDMEKANISTIHSFCGNILKENALEVGIDPMFTVLDENNGDMLLQEVILELLLKGIEEDDNIYNMVKLFKRDDLDKIVKELKSIYYRIRTVGYSFKTVKDMTISNIENIEFNMEDVQSIKDIFMYLIDKSRKTSKIGKLQTDEVWIKFFNDEYSRDKLVPILEYLYDNIGTNKNETDVIDNLKAIMNKVLLIKEKEYLWLYRTILVLLVEIDKEYSIRKEEKGALDYDDLQILVLKLLEDESIRKKYQDKYRHIMVDEFQDTNELQKSIFYKLCSENELLDRNNLFVVGDPKQSIYGFRGADLEVFYEVTKDIEKMSSQQTIALDKNFRTVDTILSFVNSLFDKLMSDRYISLDNYHVSKNRIDVEILEREGLETPPNIKRGDYDTYFESKLIAGRIKELVDTGTFDYRDFCLLFRASTVDYIYEDALRKYGIPYYNVGGKGLYQGQEIKDLINALKAISNRYDIISTIGFLRSPMVGLSDKTLYWILRNRGNCLLDTLDEDTPYIEYEDKTKVKEAKRLLEEFIIKKDLYGVYTLLNQLIEKTYYIDELMLKQGGKQLASNVYKFMDIALDFDKNTIGSLEDFIDYIEQNKDIDESQGKIYSESANVVKLMTIHKSKGLQFPVVIIPQMARGFNYHMDYILFDKSKGIGLKHDGIAPFYDYIKDKVRQRDSDENKRILYVAMTRAEKRLIIGNQGKNRGLKKLVKDLIDTNQTIYIDRVDAGPNSTQGTKVLKENFFKIKPFDNTKFPLYKQIPEYGHKVFSRINATQFVNFNKCKRMFFMKYYRRLPLEAKETIFDTYTDSDNIEKSSYVLDPITKGDIIHRFCQHYRLKLDYKQLLKQIVNSFGLEYNIQIEKELMLYIENYLKHYSEDFDTIYSEKEFLLKIKDIYIHGIIDRINIKDGECEILDFKTNKVFNKDKLIKIYEPQLQLYVNAFKRITNMEVKRAAILFLGTGELEKIDISNRSLDNNYESIKQFINFINNNNSIDKYEKSSNCEGNCRYSMMCKYD